MTEAQPTTEEQLVERLKDQPFDKAVYSEVGLPDGRTEEQLRADLAAGSDAWLIAVDEGH